MTDEWLFAAWSPDASLGLLSGHRVTGSRAWYWSAFVQTREPLLHLAEWDVKVRADPFIVKAPEMWAEHHCVAPLEQWSIGNEAFFVALDDADEALGRAYGTPTADRDGSRVVRHRRARSRSTTDSARTASSTGGST